MKTQLLTVVALLCIMTTGHINGQNLSANIRTFPGPFERNLGNPNFREGTQVIPVGIDLFEGNEVNTIHYGKTPSGSSNKPVLVFVHGYASNAQVFFKGEDNMYADVFRDGYRSVYVSLTPNDDMWTNGSMLATMINKIKSRYNNAPLVLVGWSKGGVDIDAALVHFGANTKVSEVFTLSTPHFGTGIAELANSQLLSLVNIIFMQNNDATLSLQRGYMNYFRSITDRNSRNTVPYTTIGGWGNGPLNRLDIPQGILHLIDGAKSQGGNDGVVPYSSSIRPGASELFGGLRRKYGFFGPYYDGPDETNLDHFEVTRGGKVWPFIKNSLRQSSRGRQQNVNEDIPNPNTQISSRMQWVIPSDDDYLMINTTSEKSRLIVISDKQEPVNLINDEQKLVILSSSLSQKTNTGSRVFTLEDLLPGKYEIENRDAFAFLVEEEGPEMRLDMKKAVLPINNSGLLDINLTFNDLEDDEVIDIEAYLIPSLDLEMNELEPQKVSLAIEQSNDQFKFYFNTDLKDGIYQMVVRAEGKNFKRDLMTSLALKSEARSIENSRINNWSLYPNPANETVTILLDNITSDSQLTIYTMTGKVVYETEIPSNSRSFQWFTADQQSGLYIVELQQDEGKSHQKLLIDKR